METTDENCAQLGCLHKRIKYGANCGRHHFEMLMKEPFPDRDLEDLLLIADYLGLEGIIDIRPALYWL